MILKRVSDSDGGIEAETLFSWQRKSGVIRRKKKSSEEGDGKALFIVIGFGVRERKERVCVFLGDIILRIHKSSSFSNAKENGEM
jgi:hypothetical protein